MSKAKKLPKKLTVVVTSRDIERGKRGDACKCAVARALRRALNTKRYVAVSDGNVMEICRKYNKKSQWGSGSYKAVENVGCYAARTDKTKQRVSTFIEKFDDEGRKAVKPMKFVVVLQEEKGW